MKSKVIWQKTNFLCYYEIFMTKINHFRSCTDHQSHSGCTIHSSFIISKSCHPNSSQAENSTPKAIFWGLWHTHFLRKNIIYMRSVLCCNITQHSVITPYRCFRKTYRSSLFVSLFLAQQPPVGQGLLIHKVSRSHTTTHQSVGFLWMSEVRLLWGRNPRLLKMDW